MVCLGQYAAYYFLVVNPKVDVDFDQGHVRPSAQGWVSLKGSVEYAFYRYCWGKTNRVEFEASLRDVVCLRFTLTHAGQSAVYLGHFNLEQRGWSRQPTGRIWKSAVARYRGDMPMRVEESTCGQDSAHCQM